MALAAAAAAATATAAAAGAAVAVRCWVVTRRHVPGDAAGLTCGGVLGAAAAARAL